MTSLMQFRVFQEIHVAVRKPNDKVLRKNPLALPEFYLWQKDEEAVRFARISFHASRGSLSEGVRKAMEACGRLWKVMEGDPFSLFPSPFSSTEGKQFAFVAGLCCINATDRRESAGCPAQRTTAYTDMH